MTDVNVDGSNMTVSHLLRCEDRLPTATVLDIVCLGVSVGVFSFCLCVCSLFASDTRPIVRPRAHTDETPPYDAPRTITEVTKKLPVLFCASMVQHREVFC